MGHLHGVGGETTRPRLIDALKTSTFLSLFFFVVYGGTNWITAHRSDVGTWYFPWEMSIPFVPLMIIPYMSVDLFFFAAPFLCGSRVEMRTLARRIVLGITIAGIFFLAMPLKLGYPRPVVTGWLGAIYNPFLANNALTICSRRCTSHCGRFSPGTTSGIRADSRGGRCGFGSA